MDGLRGKKKQKTELRSIDYVTYLQGPPHIFKQVTNMHMFFLEQCLIPTALCARMSCWCSAHFFFPCTLAFNMAMLTVSKAPPLGSRYHPFGLSLSCLSYIAEDKQNSRKSKFTLRICPFSLLQCLRQMTFAETGKESPGFLWAPIDERRIVRDDE